MVAQSVSRRRLLPLRPPNGSFQVETLPTLRPVGDGKLRRLRRSLLDELWELFSDHSLQGSQSPVIFGWDEADRMTHRLSSAGPSDAMDVILGVRREIKIDDVSDAFNVNAPGGNIRCHKHAGLSILKILQARALWFWLRLE